MFVISLWFPTSLTKTRENYGSRKHIFEKCRHLLWNFCPTAAFEVWAVIFDRYHFFLIRYCVRTYLLYGTAYPIALGSLAVVFGDSSLEALGTPGGNWCHLGRPSDGSAYLLRSRLPDWQAWQSGSIQIKG